MSLRRRDCYSGRVPKSSRYEGPAYILSTSYFSETAYGLISIHLWTAWKTYNRLVYGLQGAFHHTIVTAG